MQKQSKAINCDSIRPSTKPIPTHKSDSFQSKRQNATLNTDDKRNYANIDSIKERQTTAVNLSNFHQHHIYNSSRDLASSFSFSEEDQEYQLEKTIFAKFLLSTQLNYLAFLRDMNKINKEDMLDFVKIGDDRESVQRNRVIAHFIAVWLQSMGYSEFQTKKKIIMNLQFLFEEEEGISQVGAKLFDSLFHGYLPQRIQLKLLIQVCKKGWEYFSFFMGRYIKCLRKFKGMREEDFLIEIERSI